MMLHTHDIIHTSFKAKENDGLTTPEDCKWTNYLLTLDSDHLEVIGLNPGHPQSKAMLLAIDNLKLHETLGAGPVQTTRYNVDHLR